MWVAAQLIAACHLHADEQSVKSEHYGPSGRGGSCIQKTGTTVKLAEPAIRLATTLPIASLITFATYIAITII